MTQQQDNNVDVVIIGGGPAGSYIGGLLAQEGLKVLLLEKDDFPRYHVGESLTGTAGDVLRAMGLGDEMTRRGFPEKTGVKVLGRQAKSEFFVPVASPTWQVRRDEFDEILLDRAIELGVERRQGTVRQVLREGEKVVGLVYREGEGEGALSHHVNAKWVVDASGQTSLLSKFGVAGPRQMGPFGNQIAVFSQVEAAERDPGEMGNNTFIFYAEQLHWAWFIPLSETAVSVGVVVPTKTYREWGSSPEEVFKHGLETLNPDLARRCVGKPLVEEVRAIRNYSYQVDPFVGDGWLCVGDSHRFADPIFSFGVAFAFSEGAAAAKAILRSLREGDTEAALAEYVSYSNRGQAAAFDLIRYFWRFPAFFGFQARGALRDDYIRLLAGNCFDEEEVGALKAMRKSLGSVGEVSSPQAEADEIVRRVKARYSVIDSVRAAYIESNEDGACLSLVIDAEGPGLDSVDQLEEALYDEFGRERLAVMRWSESAKWPDPPSFEQAELIFDRQAR